MCLMSIQKNGNYNAFGLTSWQLNTAKYAASQSKCDIWRLAQARILAPQLCQK